MASNLHFWKQAPHLMQTAVSMTWTAFFSPVIAPAGQARRQAPQPLHLSACTE